MAGFLFPNDPDELKPSFKPEATFAQIHNALAIGTDEVGRGCLAGPVFAAAVHIPKLTLPECLGGQVQDSKKIQKAKLSEIAALIHETCYVAIAEASVEEIDDLNILHASLLAMKRATELLLATLTSTMPGAQFCLLVDGIYLPNVQLPSRSLKQGDARSYSIAAASIVAKVARDNAMNVLAKDFPHYGWDTNVGYGTKCHQDAIRIHGPTPHHRKDFISSLIKKEAFDEAPLFDL